MYRKELLVYFTFMDGKVILYLGIALLHLIIFNYDILYYTILSVCKTVFRKEDIVPFAATNFVIDLIVVEKQPKGDNLFSSQNS